MPALFARLRGLFTREQSERELNDEVQAHLDLQAADFERHGMTPEAARLAARRAFGGVEQMKETYRDRRGLPWIQDAQQDLRYAVRMLLKTPAFAAVAIVTLALGIGANTAIFTLLDVVLLRALPVHRPDQLVVVGQQVGPRTTTSFATVHFRELRRQRDVLSDLAAFRPWPGIRVTRNGQSDVEFGQLVSMNYFDVLGVHPFLGRLFTDADDRESRGQLIVVLSHGYWQREFGGDRAIVGRTIQIQGRAFTIVGVTPPEFFGTELGRAIALTVPVSTQPLVLPGTPLLSEASEGRWLRLIGRLAPGVSRERAAAALAVTWNRLEAASRGPRPREPRPLLLLDGAQGLNDLRNRFSRPLQVIMAVVALVLLIACTNLASLLLARATTRQQEIRLRLAIGARRGRLVRQLLTESLLLSCLGGAAGVALAYLVSDVLVRMMSRGVTPIAVDLTPNARTLVFTLLASVCAGLVFGIVPSLRTTRPGATLIVKGTTHRVMSGARWSTALLAAQSAIIVLLVVEAALFTRSLSELHRVDAGIEKGSVLLLSIRPAVGGYEGARAIALYQELTARFSQLPVRAVTLSTDTPLGGLGFTISGLSIPGGSGDAREGPTVHVNFIGPRFFETLGTPILRGRDFSVRDDEQAAPVAVLSESLARQYFGTENPIGRRIRGLRGTPGSDGRPGRSEFEVVGLVRDVKYESLRTPAPHVLYLPYLQVTDRTVLEEMAFAVRAADHPEQTAVALRAAVRAAAPDLPIYGLSTLDEQIDAGLVQERMLAALSTSFGALALLLGCVGLYGTLAYAVVRRRLEFGIRIALGAEWRTILGMIMSDSLRPVVIGIALGMPVAFAAGRVSQNLLFGVSGTDPVAYALAATTLVVSAILAAVLPARRALHTHPAVALRSE